MTERTEVDFRALDGLPLLQPAAPSTFRSAIAETARQLGITLNIVAEIDSVHLMKEMAAAGVGYGLLSKTAELRNGELSATPIVNPEIVRSIYLSIPLRLFPPAASAPRRRWTSCRLTIRSRTSRWSTGSTDDRSAAHGSR